MGKMSLQQNQRGDNVNITIILSLWYQSQNKKVDSRTILSYENEMFYIYNLSYLNILNPEIITMRQV
jgi:hypothetical protein